MESVVFLKNHRNNHRHLGFRIVAGALSALLLCSASASWNCADARSKKDKDQQGDELDSKKKKDSDSKHHPGDADSSNGVAPCISWVNPLHKPVIALLCIHGLGLYSGAYTNFGLRMARRGVATYAIDVRGFGSWMKAEGHEEVDFSSCLNDIKTALTTIRASNPGLKVFLLGESMGGAIALRAASEDPTLIDGLISAVPAGDRFQQKRTDLKVALQFLRGKNKQFDIGTGIVNQATKNDKLREDWSSNPLDRMTLSPVELIQFQKFMNDNHDVAKNICTMPVLFMQGTLDKLVKPEGTWDLFNEVTTEQKYFLAVPSEHLIFEEGNDKAKTFDSRIADITATWISLMSGVKLPRLNDKNAINLESGIDQLVLGNYQVALTHLQLAVKDAPEDADAHMWLGLAYMKLRRPVLAKAEWTKGRTLGHGGSTANEANNLMLESASDMNQSDLGSGIPPEGDPVLKQLTNGTPTVVGFYAPWCQQCDDVEKNFTRAQALFGDRVRFVKVNVDDVANAPLMKVLSVGPVPTYVFLTSNGQRSSTILGETSEINFALGINGILK